MNTIFPNKITDDYTSVLVAKWLLICCGLVFLMVVIGGITRLTGSGLSMVDWRPLMGIIPPITSDEWQKTFEMYQSTPEFLKKNFNMDIHGFKEIFFLEYVHRLLGRITGLVFLIPFIYFVYKNYIKKNDIPKYIIMFILGGMQGILGWYMVKSGLINNPAVSQYRLTAHLIAAFLVYGFMFWVALSLLLPSKNNKSHPWFRITIAVTILIIITIISGGFVAGLKAGKIYNTFPMMGNFWVPPDILAIEPAWKNLFENMATAQFNHRILAISTFIIIIIYGLKIPKLYLSTKIRKGITALIHTAALQVILGISTLLLIVPTVLAALHQAVAMLLFTISLFLCHGLYRERSTNLPKETILPY